MAFTKENAALMSQLGHAKRWHSPKPELPPETIAELPENSGKIVAMAEDGFREQAKLRAREHIKKLQGRIDDLLDRRELDVKAMRDLADAVLKLEQVEQRLSGRPLPGTLKPTAKPQRRSQELPSPTPSEE